MASADGWVMVVILIGNGYGYHAIAKVNAPSIKDDDYKQDSGFGYDFNGSWLNVIAIAFILFRCINSHTFEKCQFKPFTPAFHLEYVCMGSVLVLCIIFYRQFQSCNRVPSQSGNNKKEIDRMRDKGHEYKCKRHGSKRDRQRGSEKESLCVCVLVWGRQW